MCVGAGAERRWWVGGGGQQFLWICFWSLLAMMRAKRVSCQPCAYALPCREDASAVLQLHTRFVKGNTELMDVAVLETHLLNEILQHHARVSEVYE